VDESDLRVATGKLNQLMGTLSGTIEQAGSTAESRTV
jgi:hypothetical protein